MDQDEQPPNCPLLSLPAELRLRIYDYLYKGQEPHRCTFHLVKPNAISAFSIPAFGHVAAASHLRTCKQINNEATPLFYASISFVLAVFGNKQPPIPLSAQYSSIESCPTFWNIRNLTIILHVCNISGISTIFRRLSSALALLDGSRRLRECHVQLVLYDGRKPEFSDAKAALAIVKWILKAESRGGLSTLECQVYTLLWSEAVRVSCRQRLGSRYQVLDPEPYEEFKRFLNRVNASEKREVANRRRAYGLRRTGLS